MARPYAYVGIPDYESDFSDFYIRIFTTYCGYYEKVWTTKQIKVLFMLLVKYANKNFQDNFFELFMKYYIEYGKSENIIDFIKKYFGIHELLTIVNSKQIYTDIFNKIYTENISQKIYILE